MERFVLALDQGTTSSRAIVFNAQGRAIGQAQREHKQYLPWPGHVEHDAEEIWTAQREVARAALAQARVAPAHLAAIGITNQRETVVVWDRASGRPVAQAIVWQSRVSAPICERLKAAGAEPFVRQKTGLLLDPYFTATKLCWLFEQQPELRRAAERGDVLCGTIDSFLVWRLTNGQAHVTDVSNASRTLLFNLQTLDWDDELLRLFDLPRAMLPRVVPSSGELARTAPEHVGAAIPIGGIAGDQQAAAFGQACFSPGLAKNTYGTGCFLLCNTGERPVESQQRLLSTVGWQIDGRTTYFLEGSVFVAGAAVQWLRDGLGLIQSSSEIESLASQVSDAGGAYFVPALTGLGAPYWDPYARGTIVGLTRGTTKSHLARATLEAMAYQTYDLLAAMNADAGQPLTELRVDGGASVNNLLLQFQADLLGVSVSRPRYAETTALGAAYLAGLAVGVWPSQEALSQLWHEDRRFSPQMPTERRERLLNGWRRAVQRALDWEQPAEESRSRG